MRSVFGTESGTSSAPPLTQEERNLLHASALVIRRAVDGTAKDGQGAQVKSSDFVIRMI
jgi:hypothetical protein